MSCGAPLQPKTTGLEAVGILDLNIPIPQIKAFFILFPARTECSLLED